MKEDEENSSDKVEKENQEMIEAVNRVENKLLENEEAI